MVQVSWKRGESLESSVSYTHLLYDQMIADVARMLTKLKYAFFYKEYFVSLYFILTFAIAKKKWCHSSVGRAKD